MPYELFPSKSKWCVRNKESGENKGCSKTKKDAVAHMRALYRVESGGEMTGKKGKPFKLHKE